MSWLTPRKSTNIFTFLLINLSVRRVSIEYKTRSRRGRTDRRIGLLPPPLLKTEGVGFQCEIPCYDGL